MAKDALEVQENSLMLFNSMSKKKELFVPIQKDSVSMYVCGVTVYDFSNIGVCVCVCVCVCMCVCVCSCSAHVCVWNVWVDISF